MAKEKEEKVSVGLILEGAELTDEAKQALEEKLKAIVKEQTDKNVAFILEQKLREAKVNIYKALKAKAKEAFMEAINLVREETQNDADRHHDQTTGIVDHHGPAVGGLWIEVLEVDVVDNVRLGGVESAGEGRDERRRQACEQQTGPTNRHELIDR